MATYMKKAEEEEQAEEQKISCVSQQKPRSCWISLSSSSFCCYCSRLHYTHAPSFFFSVSFFILILVLAAVCTKSPLRFLLAVRTKGPPSLR